MHKSFKRDHTYMLKQTYDGWWGKPEPMEKLNQWKICVSHFVLLSAERFISWFSESLNIGAGDHEKWEK